MTPRAAFFTTLKVGTVLALATVATTLGANAISSANTLLVAGGTLLLLLIAGLAVAWGVKHYPAWREYVKRLSH